MVEQTGYPPEVVELDADLEADLGIDSIKKAQLFGELSEYFDVQPTENMTLDDFPTLRHVMNFLAGAQTKGTLAGGSTVSPPASATAPVPQHAPAAVAPPAWQAPAPQPAAAAHTQNGSATMSLDPAELEKFLINFVVEQTGYPPEVVELDADLEADLGIDSIKKAQLFGELAEYFDVQPTENMTLDDFPTLRHVMNFLAGAQTKGTLAGGSTVSPPTPTAQASSPSPAPTFAHQPAPIVVAPPAWQAPAPQPAAAAHTQNGSSTTSLDPAELEKFLINFVVEQTGYPPEVVELDADLEADLGIDSIKKAQLFGELAEYFDVQPTENMTLDDFPTLRHVLNFLAGAETKGTLAGGSTVSPPTPTAQASSPSPAPTFAHQPAPVVVAPPAWQAPAPQPAAAAHTQNGSSTSSLDPAELEKFLINFVVEQTGYPPEVVELDADLEADLGIDSIKKAQLFGELAEYFDVQPTREHDARRFPDAAPRAEFPGRRPDEGNIGRRRSRTAPVHAAASPTQQVAPAAAAPPAWQAPAPEPVAAGAGGPASLDPAELEKFLVNFVVEQTGYPPEVVELDADLEADLGIDSIKKRSSSASWRSTSTCSRPRT